MGKYNSYILLYVLVQYCVFSFRTRFCNFYYPFRRRFFKHLNNFLYTFLYNQFSFYCIFYNNHYRMFFHWLRKPGFCFLTNMTSIVVFLSRFLGLWLFLKNILYRIGFYMSGCRSHKPADIVLDIHYCIVVVFFDSFHKLLGVLRQFKHILINSYYYMFDYQAHKQA